MTNNTNQPDDTDAKIYGTFDKEEHDRLMGEVEKELGPIGQTDDEIETVEVPVAIYDRLLQTIEVYEIDRDDDAMARLLDITESEPRHHTPMAREERLRLGKDIEDGRYD